MPPDVTEGLFKYLGFTLLTCLIAATVVGPAILVAWLLSAIVLIFLARATFGPNDRGPRCGTK